MDANSLTPTAPTKLDRAMDWILDRDGMIYGDERERVAWYEAIAAVASLQWILVPWALAIMVWLGDDNVAGYLAATLAVFSLPTLLANVWIGHKRVRPVTGGWTRKRIVITIISVLPYAIFVAGLFAHSSNDPGVIIWTSAGGTVGALAGLAFTAMMKRRGEASIGVDNDE